MQVKSIKTIGVLALQGDFAEHLRVFRELGAMARIVRTAEDLFECSALVIPGGESTTMSRLLDETGLRSKIVHFWKEKKKAIWGLCAGSILLGKEVLEEGERNSRVDPLGLMDIVVDRNAYGRQLDSFVARVRWFPPTPSGSLPTGRSRASTPLKGGAKKSYDDGSIEAVFIRSPKITEVGNRCEVLARYKKSPVVVRQGRLLATVFHPELTEDRKLHEFFLSMI